MRSPLVWACVAAAIVLVPDVRSDPVEAGPFAHEFKLTLDPGDRAEAAGPLFYYERRAAGWEQWAMSPFLAYTHDRELDSEEFDVLYPFITYDRFGPEYKFKLFLLTTFTGGRDQEENHQHRFTLFPLIFVQRSPVPEKNYTAVLPFYGTIKDRLFRDQIHFVLFPLYGQTRKRGVVTDNYLFPIFHLRHGEGLTGWQFWPLAGQETQTLTVHTNAFGDVETLAGHRKFFALWPLYFDEHTGLGTTNPATQHTLVPFYSLTRSPARDSTSYLWPLFIQTDDREKQYREWDAPWPLIVFARGEGKAGNRIWPLFSSMKSPTVESGFLLWPLYKVDRIHAEPLERERQRVLFFLYSDVTEQNTMRHTTLRRTDLWPLFTAHRDHEGNERLQLLAPLEPFLPNVKSVERDYSQLWSIWRAEYNPTTGARSRSLLWNLYRLDTTPRTRKCSLLFGLFQYQSTPAGGRLRLFYVPLTRPKAPATAPAGP